MVELEMSPSKGKKRAQAVQPTSLPKQLYRLRRRRPTSARARRSAAHWLWRSLVWHGASGLRLHLKSLQEAFQLCRVASRARDREGRGRGGEREGEVRRSEYVMPSLPDGCLRHRRST